MRKVYDSVTSGDGVAAARGKQARLDIMVRWSACCAGCCCCGVMRSLPQDKYTPEAVASEMEKRVQVPSPDLVSRTLR
jgi:hypothetical protein